MVGAKGLVGTREHKANTAEVVSVYPNPAGSFFRFDQSLISSNPGDRLVVYNLMGAVVKEQNLQTSLVQVDDLPEGLYIVKMRSRGNSYIAKLIIHH